LQGEVAVETVVKERHCRAPHEENHSLEVKLGTKSIHLLRMVHHRMITE
jgi:hypothetical protein